MNRNLNWIYNAFGFLDVWLPYGTEATVHLENGETYQVNEAELRTEANNQTLKGGDITVFHPEGGAVTPENFRQTVVGTVIGDVRENKGVFEVRCLIKDAETIDLVKSGKLTETSAVYLSRGDDRVYNSIAIVPSNYARLGRKMTLKAEAKPPIHMNEEDIKKIVEGVTADFKLIESETSAIEEKKETLRAEAYAEGLNAGKELGRKEAEIVASAASIGFEGSDAAEAANHLIDTQFPGLRAESMSDSEVMLLVQAAMKTVSCKTCGVKDEITPELEEIDELRAESVPEFNSVFDVVDPTPRKQLPRRTI